jgi:hypothetical protein
MLNARLASSLLPHVVAIAGCPKPSTDSSEESSSSKRHKTSPSTTESASASASASSAARAHPDVVADHKIRAIALDLKGKTSQRWLVGRDGDDVWGVSLAEGATTPQRRKGTVRDDGALAFVDAPAPATKGRDAGPPAAGGTLVVRASDDGALRWWHEDAKGSTSTRASAHDNAPWPSSESALTVGMSGHLGSKLAVRAQLQRDGGTLKGFYRYATSTEDMSVAGTIDAHTGIFSIAESSPKGQVTGHWEGAFLSPKVAAGTWLSGDRKRSMPFTLTASVDDAITKGPDGLMFQEKLVEKTLGRDCTSSERFPEAHGLVPASRNEPLTAALRALMGDTKDFACPEPGDPPPPATYTRDDAVRIDAVAGSLLAVTVSNYVYTGGAHGIGGTSCTIFDLDTRKNFDLATVLGDDVRAALDKLVVAEVADMQREDGVEGFGDGSHPAYCYQDRDHVVAQFQIYEVVPYAFGAPSFPHDVKDLVAKMPASPARKALFGK